MLERVIYIVGLLWAIAPFFTLPDKRFPPRFVGFFLFCDVGLFICFTLAIVNSFYIIFGWSQVFILEGLAPLDLGIFFPFYLKMNVYFDTFIAYWLSHVAFESDLTD
jgi:hypothetical protein